MVINNALTGKDIPVYGDGKNVRDWLYVEDHCRAIMTVLEHGLIGQTYNIGGESEKQNIDVVTTICDLVDKKAEPLANGNPRTSLITYVTDRAGHDRRYAIDAGKISSSLGWQPSIDFTAGMEKTVAWYLDNPAWIKAIHAGTYQD